ncbi:hypothetical protein CALK_2175 [Chitinivibrio alkaliphilus ACht1]|uniref:Uncharacterized protein n=1 Tax=Chitinivibrio alkaliphilus ACht1 TaxID=1313304 RepID=U7D398_9BACT|nr:hypothetical protein CALK_2175 [Chitinivibrio alkaliphilus ACht1]
METSNEKLYIRYYETRVYLVLARIATPFSTAKIMIKRLLYSRITIKSAAFHRFAFTGGYRNLF